MVLCLIRNINMETPYKIDRMPNQLHYTYLDTFGRPVLVATKNNLVEQHIQDVVVRQEIKKKEDATHLLFSHHYLFCGT